MLTEVEKHPEKDFYIMKSNHSLKVCEELHNGKTTTKKKLKIVILQEDLKVN